MSTENPFARLLGQPTITARLAVLQPGDPTATLRVTLADYNIRETSYEVVSYDRAKDDDIAEINVDGEPQSIPKALESALKAFRRREKPRTLWADMLAGRDVEERSTQTSTMRAVLETCERTLCWLGPDQDNTGKAFDVIQEMANLCSQATLQAGMGPSIARTTMEQMSAWRNSLMTCRPDNLCASSRDVWDRIREVLESGYWHSVQCIPDIVLAKEALIVNGRSNIRWKDFILATRAYLVLHTRFFALPPSRQIEINFGLVNSIEIADRRRSDGETIELLPMIHSARDCRAKDPREHVFSMLPIATPSGRMRFHSAGRPKLPDIDYRKSVKQVFEEAARYIIHERQDLMLWWNERPPCARRIKTLPSWVPDFSISSQLTTVLGAHYGLRRWWDYLDANKPLKVTEDNVLCVQAYPLDRVVYVSPLLDANNYRRICLKEWQEVPATASESFQARNERLWRTLVLDIDYAGPTMRERSKPPAEVGSSFQSMMAEERILEVLGCTPSELQRSEVQARIVANPELVILFMQAGNSERFASLVERNSFGRRFFKTEKGRFGMTAVEDYAVVHGADPNEVYDMCFPDGSPERSNAVKTRDAVNADPLVGIMMKGFGQFISQQNPQMGDIFSKVLRGEVPVPEDVLERKRQQQQQQSAVGVSNGDLVVACIGGFLPYVLRPKVGGPISSSDEASPRLSDLAADSTYELVGDCYLHGSMDGEDFQASDTTGRKFWTTDMSKLVDVMIV